MISVRPFHKENDFSLVGDFLTAHFQPGNRDGNWLQPTWEYMHSHPALDETALDRIAIWEDAGKIVGVAHYESERGEVFLEIDPQYSCLRPEMLVYAEACLFGATADGKKFVHVYPPDFDAEFEALVRSRGYSPAGAHDRPMSIFPIPAPFPSIDLPEGYALYSLADENDLHKINRVLWRGFNHPGEPPEEEVAGRAKMQSTPNFRKDLTIVVRAPDGNYASFCGMWIDAVNQIAYVEPVATDPSYRRMGLGRAAVLEGIRRCAAEGARTAFVGSDQEFYKAIGFRKIFTARRWTKVLG